MKTLGPTFAGERADKSIGMDSHVTLKPFPSMPVQASGGPSNSASAVSVACARHRSLVLHHYAVLVCTYLNRHTAAIHLHISLTKIGAFCQYALDVLVYISLRIFTEVLNFWSWCNHGIH